MITLQYCICFAIHQHESATGVHVFPILNPSPTSLPIPSLWVIPVHQPQASSLVIRKMQFKIKIRYHYPTPVLLPGGSHGQGSLVGCGPWGCWGSDMTERLCFHFSLSCIGEGNGNPLQCSCLENPWTVEPGGLPSMRSQSRAQLKWLSSSSSKHRFIKSSSY